MWPAQCVLFAERTAQVTDRQSTCARVGNSSKHEACFAQLNFFIAQHQRGNSQPAHLLRDVMAAVRASRPSWTAPSGRDSIPSCRIPTTRAAMTSPCASKANLAFRGVPHANTCALPVRDLRRALCEQNTLRRPHRASHTCPPGEPVRSESIYPA